MNTNDYRLRAYASAAKQNSSKDSSSRNFGASVAGRGDKFDPSVTVSVNASKNAIKQGGLLKVPSPKKFVKTGAGEKESVYRRVAKFLMLIGSDEASSILKFLPQEDIEKIIPELATVPDVDPDEAREILAEFHNLVELEKESGGGTTARNILEKAFGSDKAQDVMGRVEKKIEIENPFTYLKEKKPEEILKILKGEGEQVVSIVLSHLEPQKSADIINLMGAEQKKEVVLRLAKMQKIAPEVISAIDQTIKKKALEQPKDDSVQVDGRGALLQILKHMDLTAEKGILEGIEKSDPDLRRDLQENLFTVDDVLYCDDLYLEKRLRNMNDRDIAYLIADKDDAFRGKILRNVSTGRGSQILEEEVAAKPMKKKDVNTITRLFLVSLRIAWQKGELILKGREDDDEEYV